MMFNMETTTAHRPGVYKAGTPISWVFRDKREGGPGSCSPCRKKK